MIPDKQENTFSFPLYRSLTPRHFHPYGLASVDSLVASIGPVIFLDRPPSEDRLTRR
jgi:hypothetical protein